MIAQRALTGDDLTIDDVWAIAVEDGRAVLSDAAREQMHAAREVVDRAAHGRTEHTYGVNTGFGRFVSQSIPEELTGELQLRLLRPLHPLPNQPAPHRLRPRNNSFSLPCLTVLNALITAKRPISRRCTAQFGASTAIRARM